MSRRSHEILGTGSVLFLGWLASAYVVAGAGCSSGSPTPSRPTGGGGDSNGAGTGSDTANGEKGQGATSHQGGGAAKGSEKGSGTAKGSGGIEHIDVAGCTGLSCLDVNPDRATGSNCNSLTPRIQSVRPTKVRLHAIQLLTENPSPSPTDAGADACGDPQIIVWTAPPKADPTPPPPPPKEETYSCPTDTRRIHVRELWSTKADPTLGTLQDRPTAVLVVDTKNNYQEYSARQDSPGCEWYSVCLPSGATQVQLKAMGGTSCAPSGSSGTFDLSKIGNSSSDIYVTYQGTSATLKTDFGAYPPPVGAKAFQVTADAKAVPAQCSPGSATDADATPKGFVKLHIRWPWGDPSVTGFPGTNCDKIRLGHGTPPYPTSLKFQNLDACPGLQAMLDFQDGQCPWYTALVPESAWSGGATPTVQFGVPDWSLQLTSPPVPLPKPASGEMWVAYGGPPDDAPTEGVACLDYSMKPTSFHVYSQNPGPGYAHCGGGADVKIDPCNPPPPASYSVVHFRYLWAGQKTFTFFPRPDLMPKWIMMEVNGTEVTCTREQDRPWFNCPVPNAEFRAGATWRAVDKTREPTEWNTVQQRPFATKPGEYWLRWDYGKPDMTSGEFKFFDYYPDGTHGDWSATGQWHDEACAAKPPATPVSVGYTYGGWFPYKRTNFAYQFGASLAHVYADSASVQDLLNAFVFQRYERWKKNYVLTDDLTCGADTARVNTDPGPTVSEGQGYGIAISAAIGDKETFSKLWNFTRHYLSQSAKKYCGGLMGWMWDGVGGCRPLDQPCDPDKDGCGGNDDSAFDGDVDIAIGLVFAARQWPEYTEAAINWLIKMECEINAAYDGKWNYPAPGDTFDKLDCSGYPDRPCTFSAGQNGRVNLSYYPPGYFRVFGDFLQAYLSPGPYSDADRQSHHDFWYKTAETVYELYERCYDNKSIHPALVNDWGTYTAPCDSGQDNYNWSRTLWRVGIDAAWFGNRLDLPENQKGSSSHYPTKSRMQAKIDNIQDYYSNFYKTNTPEPNANRFSTLCNKVTPAGTAKDCDPGFDHNSYFVNTAMCAFASIFDDDGKTTPEIRREALEEAVSTTVENDKYYQESIGVYTMLFLSGNFPNPMAVK